MQTSSWKQDGDIDAFDLHRFNLRLRVETLFARKVDHVTAGIVAFATDHTHVMRQRWTVLARLFAVDHEQTEIAARRYPHRPRTAVFEASVHVFIPQVEGLHDVHIGIDHFKTVLHDRSSLSLIAGFLMIVFTYYCCHRGVNDCWF